MIFIVSFFIPQKIKAKLDLVLGEFGDLFFPKSMIFETNVVKLQFSKLMLLSDNFRG